MRKAFYRTKLAFSLRWRHSLMGDIFIVEGKVLRWGKELLSRVPENYSYLKDAKGLGERARLLLQREDYAGISSTILLVGDVRVHGVTLKTKFDVSDEQ